MGRNRLSLSGAVAVCGALMATALSPVPASALPYDGTNPANTVCGDPGSTIWTLGIKPHNDPAHEGKPTGIYYLGVKIGEVEIRHSRKCATVWARVRNLSGAAAQVKATIVVFSDSNGGGRTEHPGSTDTVGNGSTSFSDQYRDRASFSAKGAIFHSGAWRTAETARSVAWVQYSSNFPLSPYACNHTGSWPCQRWPILSNGLSVTRHYGLHAGLASMPTSSGTRDIRGDVRFMFNQFNDVPASNPFFFEDTYAAAEVKVFPDNACYRIAAGWGLDLDGDNDYDIGEVFLSKCNAIWGSSDATREALCHEFDHVMGLNHVWQSNPAETFSNVGSKATCIGMGSATGPRIDDDSALDALYSGVIP